MGLPRHLGVDLDAAAEPRARGEPAAAPAERDPAVAGGAEVVHERAGVGDALAAGPAELLEHVGDRLGQDDVRGGDRDPRAQRLEAARGGVDGQHGGARAHAAAGGLGRHAARRRVQRAHPRALVDRDARAMTRARRPSASRAGWTVASSATSSPRRKRGESQRARTPPRVSARTRLRRRRGDDRRRSRRRARARWRPSCSPARREPGVDALLGAPRADRLARSPTTRGRPQRPLAAEALDQRRQVRPQRLAEAAVAPARPVAAQLGLQQRPRKRRARAAATPSTGPV